jgi:aminobenzoyl-glutamate utilization protein B
LTTVFAFPLGAGAASPEAVESSIGRGADGYATLALQIWEIAEVGYQEVRSSGLLQAELRSAGFQIDAGVAGMPTAFVAEAGEGHPVIGILAEFDALPGMSQDAVAERRTREEGAAGHACGHHLFGVGSIAAGVAVKSWLAETGRAGTLRVYGTPAEEGGAGKAYMARAGMFADADAVLHWHPGDRNQVGAGSTLSNKSGKFRFHGEAAHAARAPERGRSALDGVEAMNFMANMLREHVPEETRIHYVITRGGDAPNIVPRFAEVFYYVRHPDPAVLAGIWQRVVAASEGAAAGTGTRVEHEIIHGSASILPNETLAGVIDANLQRLGGIDYDPSQQAFAEKIRASLITPDLELGSEAEIQPLSTEIGKASTDVGDVSWNAPTAGLVTATWVPGTPPHSWQAVAAGGTSIGVAGMMLAARTLAATAVDLFENPSILKDAREELERRRGRDFEYVPLVGDRDPPLDYRD